MLNNMRSAKEAAEQTAKAKSAQAFEFELDLIQQRIDGASAAGQSTVEIVFEGNVFDEETIQTFSQVLIDLGYQVKFKQNAKHKPSNSWQFNISW
jgi:hypothetical protein